MVDISIVSMTFYNIQKYQQNCRGFKFPDVAIPEFFFGRCPGFPHLVGGLEHVYFPFHIWDVILQPLTKSIIFQDGEIAPPTSYPS